MSITFERVPGFADLPNSLFDAEKFAVGRHISAISENTKFGLVVPEFFQGTYKHGDTVPLPVSATDHYQYSQGECIFIWAIQSTANPANNWSTGPGSLWYAQWFVNQTTGKVTCEEYYRTSGSQNGKSNDGSLLVTTIAIRRKGSLTTAEVPAFVDVADASLARDKALTTGSITQIKKNSEFGVLSSEVIYMGQFGNGEVIPNPVSPIDGHVYSYAEVASFQHSWVWTPPAATYATPTGANGKPQNQVHRLEADVDGTGHVTTAVTYYDDHTIGTNDGLIAVFAFCSRPCTVSGTVGFAWVNEDDVRIGHTLNTDTLVQINRNSRFSALRPEFFLTSGATNGSTIALPVSPVDGYAYSRDELQYVPSLSSTGPEDSGHIRILQFYSWVDPASGSVAITTIRLRDGGTTPEWTNEGSVKVLTIATRQRAAGDPPVATPAPTSGGTADESGVLNGGFDKFTNEGQTIADGWTADVTAGSASFSREDGL